MNVGFVGPLKVVSNIGVDPKVLAFVEWQTRPLLNMFNHFLALDKDFDE